MDMAYLQYLVCLVLLAPAAGMSLFFLLIGMVAKGPRKGWLPLLELLGYFGEGLVEPLTHGWRILALLACLGLGLFAGAIPELRQAAFAALAGIGLLAVGTCLYVSRDNPVGMLIFISPSIVSVACSTYFYIKLRA